MKCEKFTVLSKNRRKTRDSLDTEKYSFLYAHHIFFSKSTSIMIFAESENRIRLSYSWKRVDLTAKFSSLWISLKAVRKYLRI